MGMIAPVTAYQYMQYQNREIGIRYDPFQTFPIEKITPIKEGEKGTYHKSAEENQPNPNKGYQLNVEKFTDSKIAIKVYGEITGKGKIFNELI